MPPPPSPWSEVRAALELIPRNRHGVWPGAAVRADDALTRLERDHAAMRDKIREYRILMESAFEAVPSGTDIERDLLEALKEPTA